MFGVKEIILHVYEQVASVLLPHGFNGIKFHSQTVKKGFESSD
jgi:hypothetical protein